MEKMLSEVNYCKKVIRNNFNKPLKMTKDDVYDLSKQLINAIYAVINILTKTYVLETIVILLENIEAQRIKNVM